MSHRNCPSCFSQWATWIRGGHPSRLFRCSGSPRRWSWLAQRRCRPVIPGSSIPSANPQRKDSLVRGWRACNSCASARPSSLCRCRPAEWPRLTYWLNVAFAMFMLGAATFSHAPRRRARRPGRESAALDLRFRNGVRLLHWRDRPFAQRGTSNRPGRALDVVALVAATIMPVFPAGAYPLGGLAQRVMFSVAYLWYGRDGWHLLRSSRTCRCRRPDLVGHARPHVVARSKASTPVSIDRSSGRP